MRRGCCNWLSPLGITLLLVVPPSLASEHQAERFLRMQSSTLTLEEAATDASLVALTANAIQGAPQAPPGFVLYADQMLLEIDRSEATILGAVHLVPEDPSREHVSQVHLEGVTNREGHALAVIAAPGSATANVTSSCFEGTASPHASVSAGRFVDLSRTEQTADTSDALMWKGCGTTIARIRGDFVLSLWEWDANLTHDGTNRFITTGNRPVPAATPAHPYVGESEQAWAFVENGELTIPIEAGSALYTSSLSGVASEVRLGDVVGEVHDGESVRHVAAEEVLAQGNLRVGVAALGDAVASELTGSIDSVKTEDGVIPLATAPPVRYGSFEPTMWILLALGGIVLLSTAVRPAAVGYWSRRRLPRALRPTGLTECRAEGHHELSLRWERRRRLRWALHHLQRAMDLVPDNPSYLVQRAVLQRRLRRFHEALADHREAYLWLRIDPTNEEATFNAMEAARVAALTRQRDMAFWWLGQAISGEPERAVEVDGEPDFSTLRQDPRYHIVKEYGRLGQTNAD